MALPELSLEQVEELAARVAEYIGRQREEYRCAGTALTEAQRRVMEPFFAGPTIEEVRLVVVRGRRVGNPPFYGELVRMGFRAEDLPNFAYMAAITFVDTVVSHEAFSDRLLFHEMVHVVQYEKLGLQEFAVRYVRGFLTGGAYEEIPLERNAYELDARFASAPMLGFSVEDEVWSWLNAGRL